MKNAALELQVSPCRHRTRWMAGARVLSVCGALGICGIRPLQAEELPKSLVDAMERAGTEDARRAYGTLRRYAYTDQSDQRLEARIALARLDVDAGNLSRAASWVEEYQHPRPENLEWPRIRAYGEAAKIAFMRGKAFEGVKRLTDAREATSGLAKISAERDLSWMVEQKPDLDGALEYETSALKTGNAYFRRTKISETAGWEPPKPGTDQWNKIRPEIQARIADLKRKIDIETYGLDFVLYKEAQHFRKASHPLALDFTNVAVAFGEKGSNGGKVPGANYEMAAERYREVARFFPEDNPYGQAAKLYLAVCAAKMGDADEAIKHLKTFYKEDPDGLYRGEALKLMGDLYLFAKWDKRNSKEAYERSIRWIEATKKRVRALDAYLIPEKSAKASRPPRAAKRLSHQGQIQRVEIPESALVNRITSEWYLNGLMADVEWKLGFLALTEDKWDEAFQHFDRTLNHDAVLKKARQGRFFNPYDRLKVGRKNGAIVGTVEQSRGLSPDIKVVMYFADIKFMLGDFDEAFSMYRRIQRFARGGKSGVVYTRAVLGEMLVRRQNGQLDPIPDISRMHNVVLEYPESPSAPYLLELCALVSRGKPLPASAYFAQIYTQYPGDPFFAPRARYNEILRCVPWRDTERRREMILAFKRDYPGEEGYIEALTSLDKQIMAWHQEWNRK